MTFAWQREYELWRGRKGKWGAVKITVVCEFLNISYLFVNDTSPQTEALTLVQTFGVELRGNSRGTYWGFRAKCRIGGGEALRRALWVMLRRLPFL